VLIACWSTKGGSGTTVVSAALASVLAETSAREVLLADLGGDCPAVLGLPDPDGPGLSDWLAAGGGAPAGSLGRLELAANRGVRVLPWGDSNASPRPDAGERLLAALSADARLVVVDCGPPASPVGIALAAGAGLSLLVLRPCYIALRRALAAPVRPSGVVLVEEPGRSLGRSDVEDVLGVPVRAQIQWDPAVARSVDAGLLGTRVPRPLHRALRAAA
jgi:MinD-like ATPase involved in chromosome partitioning or flagellar assembly